MRELIDSAEVQKTPLNEGIFAVVNSLKQELKEEEMGPHVNAALENVVNALIKEGLHEEKPQEKLNKYHRSENCESLTKVQRNQPRRGHITPAV